MAAPLGPRRLRPVRRGPAPRPPPHAGGRSRVSPSSGETSHCSAPGRPGGPPAGGGGADSSRDRRGVAGGRPAPAAPLRGLGGIGLWGEGGREALPPQGSRAREGASEPRTGGVAAGAAGPFCDASRVTRVGGGRERSGLVTPALASGSPPAPRRCGNPKLLHHSPR